jgi:hypothetical protein
MSESGAISPVATLRATNLPFTLAGSKTFCISLNFKLYYKYKVFIRACQPFWKLF